MKRILIAALILFMPSVAFAQDKQDKQDNQKTISFELDEEKLSIEADIPSVDLIISFREIQERNSSMKASFLDEIIDSAKDEPF
ncbi:MAG: hypothetical protein IJM59_01325 [Proteobacteria bacterium]|jgi:hypothetical protein|nr:hypothetical protein [Pseudomonadota bacterium]